VFIPSDGKFLEKKKKARKTKKYFTKKKSFKFFSLKKIYNKSYHLFYRTTNKTKIIIKIKILKLF